MKTIIRNVALLDARAVPEELAGEIERIENVAALLLSERAAGLLAGARLSNVASATTVPDGVGLMLQNGQTTLSAAPGEGRRFLLVNGELQIDPAMTPEQIRAQVAGGTVNGQVLGSASQAAALVEAGVQVNGRMHAIPDGWQARRSKRPMTLAEAQALAGKQVYLCGRTLLEAGVPGALAAGGARLAGEKVLCYAGDAQDLGRVYAGDLGACTFVPDGAAVLQDLDVSARTAFRLRGSLYLTGDLTLREDVREEHLAGLQALRVQGHALVPLSLMDAMLARAQGEVDWVPYEGTLVVNDAQMALTPETLAQADGPVALYNGGALTVDAAIEPKALRERVTLLYNDGACIASTAAQAALRPVTVGGGVFSDPEEAAEEAADLQDVRVIGNIATLTL